MGGDFEAENRFLTKEDLRILELKRQSSCLLPLSYAISDKYIVPKKHKPIDASSSDIMKLIVSDGLQVLKNKKQT